MMTSSLASNFLKPLPPMHSFDSLAAEKHKDTAFILGSLFEPIKHDTILFYWTDRYFQSLDGDYWNAAMGS